MKYHTVIFKFNIMAIHGTMMIPVHRLKIQILESFQISAKAVRGKAATGQCRHLARYAYS